MTAPQTSLIPCRLPNDTVINLMAFDLSGVGTGPYAFAPLTLGADGVSIVDFAALSAAQIAAINAITATIDNGVPITVAALPLPAGAATDAHLTNVQTAPGSSATTAVTVQGSAYGVAIPVSAASLPLPSGAATDASVLSVKSAVDINTSQSHSDASTLHNDLLTLATAAQIGEVQANPTANTVLDRLKTIASGLGAVVLAAGTAVIGKVGLQVGGSDVAASNPVPTQITGPDYQPSGATPVIINLAGSGQSSAFTPKVGRAVNLTLSGTWSGSAALERSFDSGSNWVPCTLNGQALIYTSNMSEPVWEEVETGVQLRINWTRVSGTLTGRISH